MVDGDAVLSEHFLDVSVRQSEPQVNYQQTASMITFDGNRNPAHSETGIGGRGPVDASLDHVRISPCGSPTAYATEQRQIRVVDYSCHVDSHLT